MPKKESKKYIARFGQCSRFNSARRLTPLLIIPMFVFVVSCSKTIDRNRAEQDVSSAQPHETIEANETPKTRFMEQELTQLSSPFTKETVLALNAIVSRSLSTIERFDVARREFEQKNARDSEATLVLYEDLSKAAKQANVDMAAASTRLKESGEKYNRPILAAMIRFVEDVDREIRKEIEMVSRGQSVTANHSTTAPRE